MNSRPSLENCIKVICSDPKSITPEQFFVSLFHYIRYVEVKHCKLDPETLELSPLSPKSRISDVELKINKNDNTPPLKLDDRITLMRDHVGEQFFVTAVKTELEEYIKYKGDIGFLFRILMANYKPHLHPEAKELNQTDNNKKNLLDIVAESKSDINTENRKIFSMQLMNAGVQKNKLSLKQKWRQSIVKRTFKDNSNKKNSSNKTEKLESDFKEKEKKQTSSQEIVVLETNTKIQSILKDITLFLVKNEKTAIPELTQTRESIQSPETKKTLLRAVEILEALQHPRAESIKKSILENRYKKAIPRFLHGELIKISNELLENKIEPEKLNKFMQLDFFHRAFQNFTILLNQKFVSGEFIYQGDFFVNLRDNLQQAVTSIDYLKNVADKLSQENNIVLNNNPIFTPIQGELNPKNIMIEFQKLINVNETTIDRINRTSAIWNSNFELLNSLFHKQNANGEYYFKGKIADDIRNKLSVVPKEDILAKIQFIKELDFNFVKPNKYDSNHFQRAVHPIFKSLNEALEEKKEPDKFNQKLQQINNSLEQTNNSNIKRYSKKLSSLK